MSTESRDEEKNRRFQDFEQRFEQESPYTLDVLKGHLLVEELLLEIISSQCESPKKISEAKLTFFAKNKVAEAICGSDTPIWDCVDKLNSARNELAHSITHEKLDAKIDRLIASCRDALPNMDWNGDRHYDLVMAIVGIHATLSRFATELKRA